MGQRPTDDDAPTLSEASPLDDDDNQPTLIHTGGRPLPGLPVMPRNVPVPQAPAPRARGSGQMPAVVAASAPSSDGESTMALEGPSAFAAVARSLGPSSAAPSSHGGSHAGSHGGSHGGGSHGGGAPSAPGQPLGNPGQVPAESLSSRSQLESTQYLVAPSQAAAFSFSGSAPAAAPPSSPGVGAPAMMGAPPAVIVAPEPTTLPYDGGPTAFGGAQPPMAQPYAPAPIPPQPKRKGVPLWIWVLVGILVLGGAGTAIALLVLD